MRLSRPGAAQLAVAFNLTAIAVGLPLIWNTVVKHKWNEFRSMKKSTFEKEDPVNQLAVNQLAEELAVELLINERRRERGLEPIFYGGGAESGVVDIVLEEYKKKKMQ